MAALKEPVKIFIVQSLACRDTPQEVAELVKQDFGIEVDRKQIQSYDPTKVAGKNLSKKFIQLFNETREKFDEGLIDIPIANKQYREHIKSRATIPVSQEIGEMLSGKTIAFNGQWWGAIDGVSGVFLMKR